MIIFQTSATIHPSTSEFDNDETGDFDLIGDGDLLDLGDLGEGDEDLMKDIMKMDFDMEQKNEKQSASRRVKQSSGLSSRSNDQVKLEEGQERLVNTLPLPGSHAIEVEGYKDDSRVIEEVSQQPMSVGFLVSTAPLSMQGSAIPSWLWSPEPGQGPRAVDSSGDIHLSGTGSGKKPVCIRMAM